jgi:hypothetical protein
VRRNSAECCGTIMCHGERDVFYEDAAKRMIGAHDSIICRYQRRDETPIDVQSKSMKIDTI